MTAVNWNNIRVLSGSQQDAFEELVCQLARRVPPTDSDLFVRIGKPDGGKECFWRTNSGDIYAWQAKYFPAAFSDTQWKQIDKSVTDAIDNHPRLVSFTVCCPLDRPDGKVSGRTSLLAKWDKKVRDWEAYATGKGMTVKFQYWGSSEMMDLLARKENEGMRYFWFNQEEFTDDWFAYKNEESINALGGRYTAALNFELPITRCFDGLARDDQFMQQLKKHFNKLYKVYREFHFPKEDSLLSWELQLKELLDQFKATFLKTVFNGTEKINYAHLTGILDACSEVTDNISNELYRLQSEGERKKPTPAYSSSPLSYPINQFRKITDQLYILQDFLTGPECRLTNTPTLILTGEAGAGKSHLLADLVNRRADKGQRSLFLLGESFTTRASPWSQILQHQLLKTSIDEHLFLGALDAKAETGGYRLLIVIDALNEGEGRFIWPSKLLTFIKLIQKYTHLGLVISIRDSFTNLIAPTDTITNDHAVRLQHTGFAETSYEASVHFFRHYGIVQPGSPLLNPEFQNPLFLKLFCQSLKERGLHTVPPGYSGLTAIIDFYLDGINYKLAQPNEWEFDERLKLVRRAVNEVLQRMVREDTDYLAYDVASDMVDTIFRDKCAHPQPFLKRLVSEGVFNIDLFWDDSDQSFEVVYFAYQRFQDHLIVATLLDSFLDKSDPILSFQTGKLSELVKDQRAVHLNRNLIEALSIQLPEKTGKELFEVAPVCKPLLVAAESFIRSLIWRRGDSIGTAAKEYVNDVILQNDRMFDLFMDTTISTAMRENYYFNADSLHGYLKRMTRQTRDLEWTTWLQKRYGPDTAHNAVQRLIDWGFSSTDINHIDDLAIALGSNTLAWFLVSSNRYLRDSATKSLVNLLQYRMHLILPLLQKFEKIDDIYVTERLYAVAYGCVLRTNSNKDIAAIAAYTYQQIFDQPLIVAHDLLRDYARGIVEFASFHGFAVGIDLEKVRPPYRSKKLPVRLPSVTTIDKKYKPKDDSGNYGRDNWGATAILSSMTTEYGRGTAGYGDFGRYVFGYRFSDFDIDEAKLSNYAVELIFKMGYDPALFSEFDSSQGSGRGNGYKERIGKKYQWIILHELLARVSDHCKLFERHYMPELGTIKYKGPWEGSRDIDPSVLIRKMQRDGYLDQAEGPWIRNFDHQWKQADFDWIRDASGQPDPAEVIHFRDANGVDWLWLDLHPVWKQPDEPGEDKYEGPYKEVWYLIRSYFIHKEDVAKIKKSVAAGFESQQFDEPKSLSNVFSREFYEAPAYLSFTDTDEARPDWIDIHHRKSGKKIVDVLRTTEVYFWEKEFDCSKEEAIIYNKPSLALATGLKLKYSTREGEMTDDSGETVCLDPSVNYLSSRGLLIKKTAIDNYLKKENLVLMWMVVGEKQVNARSWNGRKYPGRMNMSGIYTYENGAISGELVFQLDK